MSLPDDPGTPIAGAPHFTWPEMLASDTARKYNLDNTPGPDAQKRIIHLGRRIPGTLAPGKVRPRIKILSGYRGPELNWYVSLSRHSRHCRGEAADIRLFRCERFAAARADQAGACRDALPRNGPAPRPQAMAASSPAAPMAPQRASSCFPRPAGPRTRPG